MVHCRCQLSQACEKVDHDILYRVLDIGRHEAYRDDDQSMLSFVEFGLKLRGKGGTFKLHTCAETGQLIQWST